MFYGTALLLGLGFSALAMGIFISMRIFNIPDITTDGSFTLGGAVTGVMLVQEAHPLLILPMVFGAGALAGLATATIHTKLKVNALLSGILVMTALYSINLAIMGRSNIPLIDKADLFTPALNLGREWMQFVVLLLFTGILCLLISRLLITDFGLAMRATGHNETMIRSLGINTTAMKMAGLALANGLTAISGYLICQVQGFADIGMGIGIVILGLGAVMIGEILIKPLRIRGIAIQVIGVIAGSIVFRLILAVALAAGVNALYLKLVVSLLVLVIVSIPNLRKT